ncbi:hypothetical protein M0Q97_10285 [Candidatus Dojkabacteria bacterium]|nr:hypothetical protein [Candidatus Dojkabacteria bacterium]
MHKKALYNGEYVDIIKTNFESDSVEIKTSNNEKLLVKCADLDFQYNLILIYTEKINMNIFKLNEFYNYSTISEDELLEMSNITDEDSGIKNVVLWIEPSPTYHGKRIKVSNIPNSFETSDCFTITIPDFKIIGNINKKFITNKKIKQIMKFIELNIDSIIDYSDKKISTRKLLDNIKSI